EEYYNLMAFFNNTRDEDTPEDEPNLKFYNKNQKERVAKIHDWILKNENREVAEAYSNFMKYSEPVYHAHLAENYTNGSLAGTLWIALRDNGSCYINNIYTQGANYIFLKYSLRTDASTIIIRKDNPKGEILARFNINKTHGSVIHKFPFKKTKEKINFYIEAENPKISPEAPTSYISWFAFLPELQGVESEGYSEIDQ